MGRSRNNGNLLFFDAQKGRFLEGQNELGTLEMMCRVQNVTFFARGARSSASLPVANTSLRLKLHKIAVKALVEVRQF